MRRNRVPEIDKLFQSTGMYKNCRDYKELLEFVKRFPKLAPFNAMLIHLQKPESTFVTSLSEWTKKYRRNLKADARPLIVLRPFGPIGFVFDISDTEGEEVLSEEIIIPTKLEEREKEELLSQFVRNLSCDGIIYKESDLGIPKGMAKTIEEDTSIEISIKNKVYKVRVLFLIMINSNLSKNEKLMTAIANVAHIYCGHLGSLRQSWIPERYHLGNKEKEFEVNSVGWMVCERLGLENPFQEDLFNYLDNNETIPAISLETVLKVTALVEALFKPKLPRRDLIEKVETNYEQLSFGL